MIEQKFGSNPLAKIDMFSYTPELSNNSFHLKDH